MTGVNPFTGIHQELNLDPGTYTFEVTAFIVIGEGPRIFDLSPESITWTIEEPIVVETTLEAFDGTGDEITDGESTTSDDIVFYFSWYNKC